MPTGPQILCSAAAVATAAAVGLYGTFAPRSSLWGKVLWRATGVSRPCVSLTFDDGPTADSTDRILDLLGEAGVRATFFVIGRNAATRPQLLERIFANGHIVANHSFDHSHFDLFRGWGYWNNQLLRTDDLIAEIIGKRPAMFRPPMGFVTPPIHHAARRRGKAVITWSRGARDGIRSDAAAIIGRTVESTIPGDILMFHDGVDPHLRGAVDRAATIAALPKVLTGLRQRGLSPIRLDEMLRIPAYADGAALSASAARAVK